MNESTTVTIAVPLTGFQKFRKWLAELGPSKKNSIVLDDPLPTMEQLLDDPGDDAATEVGGTHARVTQKLAAASSTAPTSRQGSSDGVSIDDETDALLFPDPSTSQLSNSTEQLGARGTAENLESTAVNAFTLSHVFSKIAAFFLWIGQAIKNGLEALHEHAKESSALYNASAATYASIPTPMMR